jgi:internalin A
MLSQVQSSSHPQIRTLDPPLRGVDFAAPRPELRTVQFKSLPDDTSLARLAEFLTEHPELGLRVFAGYDGSITDLEFLRFFSGVQRVSIDLRYHALTSAEGLRYLSDELEELGLGATRRRLDLAPLARFTRLRRLGLEGHTKNIDVLSGITSLEDLTLRSITLPDLSLLSPLRNLRSLAIKLGGTKDLRPISEVGRLEYLEIWMVRGFSDLTPIAGMRHLRSLFLQALTRVSQLPDLRLCHQLERVYIEALKHLVDLRPLREAPSLRHLLLVDMPQLRWENVEVLKDHRTLQGLALGTGSRKRNEEYENRLGYVQPPPRR